MRVNRMPTRHVSAFFLTPFPTECIEQRRGYRLRPQLAFEVPRNALHYSIIHRDLQLLAALITYNADLNETFLHYSPLEYALINHQLEATRMLLEAGTDTSRYVTGVSVFAAIVIEKSPFEHVKLFFQCARERKNLEYSLAIAAKYKRHDVYELLLALLT